MKRFTFIVIALFAAALASCGGGGGSVSAPVDPPAPTPTKTPAPTLSPPPSAPVTPTPAPAGRIEHVVIIVQENRSTDNLFHGLPGADTASSGLNSSGQTVPLQPVDLTAPFDLDHRHDKGFLVEYNNGAMNGFDLVKTFCSGGGSGCNATAYGYVPQSEVQPYFQLAEQYTFADRMFQSNSGPSFPAHQYILSGAAMNAPDSALYVSENPGYANYNTKNCGGDPYSTVELIDIYTGAENNSAAPCVDHPTLFDSLDAKGVSYKYYAYTTQGYWDAPSAISRIYYGPDWSHVVTPNTTILTDISNNQLPAVSWVFPALASSDHPGNTDGSGPSWVASVVNAIGNSPYWQNTAIFVTWDDWGGWYDHVKPQQYNAYELGFRVPLIVISPYAKPGYVSHVQHEFGSILHFTEEQFGLASLGYTDARADDLSDCFDFRQTPIVFRTIAAPLHASYFLTHHFSKESIDSDL